MVLFASFALVNVNVAAFVVSTNTGFEIDSLRIAFLSTGRRDLPSGLGVALPLRSRDGRVGVNGAEERIGVLRSVCIASVCMTITRSSSES